MTPVGSRSTHSEHVNNLTNLILSYVEQQEDKLAQFKDACKQGQFSDAHTYLNQIQRWARKGGPSNLHRLLTQCENALQKQYIEEGGGPTQRSFEATRFPSRRATIGSESTVMDTATEFDRVISGDPSKGLKRATG